MKQVCKFCKSEIDSECYVCPICRQWLHPFRLKKGNPLLKGYIIFVVFFLCVIYVPRFFASKYLPDRFTIKEFQSAEVHRLKIISHKMRNDKNQMIILGELKNEGTDTFSLIEIEA